MTNQELIKHAQQAMNNAYAPYSRCTVGAALLCKDGSVYTGCNVENTSYGLTVCAEHTALTKAISEGQREFITIAVASNKQKSFPPCGACRQILAEFNNNIKVLWLNSDATLIEKNLSELLPDIFT